MVEKNIAEKKAKPVGRSKNVKLDIDSDLILRLAELMKKTGLNEIEIGNGNQRLRVARGGVQNIVQTETAASAMAAKTESPAIDAAPPPGAVPSPMVGTVYIAPEPGAAPFISVGDQVAKDDTLFVIEAMKVMNPIRAPRAGTVLKLMVGNGDPVEFGETLLVLG